MIANMINNQANIDTIQWWKRFLDSGAFLRISSTDYLLWCGPWELLPLDEVSKSHEFSISYMNFFETESHTIIAKAPPVIRTTAQIRSDLEMMSAPHDGVIARSNFIAPRQDVFEKTLQNILGKIQRGEVEKAVPVIFSRTERTPSHADKRNWLLNLLSAPMTLHVYGFWDSEKGIIGATPEILFRQDQGLLQTMALAGTLPKSEQGNRSSLLKDEKELHEHQLVIDDLEAQLSKIGWVRKGETKIMELPTLLHLVTLLEVETTQRSTPDLIKLLHPTPALGVAPRSYGYHWMQTLSDQEDRRLFGGPLAFSFATQTLCLVAIRNIQWNQQGCQVGAGCGIVGESQAEREWQELLLKLSSVFQLLGL